MTGTNWLEIQNRLLASYEDVRQELVRIPGVVEVGVGLRRRAGALVDEAVYVVSVRRKLPPEQVPPGELVPSEIRGVPTDVEEHTEPIPLLGFNDERDTKNYDTKVGGTRIGTEHSGGNGTLGCFCKRNDTGATVLLSCHHVLFSGNSEAGSGVGQDAWSGFICCTCNEIGEVLKGDKNLDAAIASVNADVPFLPKVRRIKKPDGTVEEEGLLLGVGDPVMNQVVWKVGWKTGLTRGTVSKVVPRIEISVNAPFGTFGQPGDSGSVVVDKATGNVVGLLVAITSADGLIGLAKKISDVFAVLNVSLLPSDPNAQYSESADEDEEPFALPPPSPFTALVDRLREHDTGRELLRVADRHRAECRELIATRR
ncbi:MAG: hypothetical protein HOV94_11735, partial [Saccharothrix sp.]|nr:hypothetical protein [Saccharothrix sp.]